MDVLQTTWHWAFSGFLIGIIMLILVYFGKNFGMSSNLRTLCSIPKFTHRFTFFAQDWRFNAWNLVVVVGAALGGFVAVQFLSSPDNVGLAASTLERLSQHGIDAPQGKLLPDFMFATSDWRIILIMIIGGFLIGFGSRYAGGCTSGHAISGLSNLQLPSLIAVIGFFIGGLLMVHLIFPTLLDFLK
jgi:uncharacterized membrane protein YedE/YeeE